MKSDQTNAVKPATPGEADGPATGLAVRILEWSARHPALAIVLVSLLAVIVNCYPVIFCGKSFASSTGVAMVYDMWPSLPTMNDVPQTSNHGSDTAAMLVWGIPAGFIESRSLLEHGELPLWDRYGHAGYTFIGQNVTMLGDPLQFIVIFGRGSAWAWDIKFLTAKVLFCVGFGLLILRLLGSRLLSLIYAAMAAYCGAFFYINNHPAYFVFCYAPWILLSALAMLDLQSGRFVRWGLVWLLANFACFNAGHVEVAVVLIGGLNLAAVVYALIRHRNIANAIEILRRLGIGTLLFLGLAAPVWISFLTTLANSYSAHSQILVWQLPFQVLVGAFDDVFYNLLRTESMAAPASAASLLVLVGCVLSLLRWRQLQKELFFWINCGAIALSGSCVFGLIPASVLMAVPMINRVGHLDTDISYWLVIQLTIQSAYGFKCLLETNHFRRTALDLLWAALILAAMIMMFCFSGYVNRPIPWDYVFGVGTSALCAPLLFAFLKSRNHRISATGWAGIIVLAFIPHFRFGLYNFGRDTWLMLPGQRTTLNAPSPAIDKIKAGNSAPFRIVGMRWNFYGDYAAVYDLEDIRSCAPLSNQEYVNLIKHFPGFQFAEPWMVEVTNVVVAQPLLNLLNVKYLMDSTRVSLPIGLDFRIVNRSDFGVVENLEAWPRAFFSDKVVSIPTGGEFINHLLANGKRPFIALTPEEIQKQPGLRKLETTADAMISPATKYRLLPNSTAFDVHAASAGMVCLTEGQAEDFTAQANNEPKEVLTVNRAFKGIYLDKPGDYHVKFTYRPRYWRLACTLFWIAAGSTIALTFLIVIRAGIQRKHGTTA
jgi:hypothetical protein